MVALKDNLQAFDERKILAHEARVGIDVRKIQ